MATSSQNKPTISTRQVLVIGAGPAGLFAAVSAARCGAHVTVLERQSEPGRKLLATGGGRCNITNTLSSESLMEKFGPTGRFMSHALKELPNTALLELLESWGVPCEASDGFHYFPRSQRAGDVVSALTRQMSNLKINLLADTSVESITIKDDLFHVFTSDGQTLRAHAVILATGGAGYPSLGGNHAGYALAEEMGHTVITPAPGLVGLRTMERWPSTCAGITIPNAEVKIAERGFKGRTGSGDLLFTHHGISGPPVIDISGSVSRLLLTQESVKISMKLCKDHSTPQDWNSIFSAWRSNDGKRHVHNAVATLLPKRLAGVLCCECGIPNDMVMARLPGSTEIKLISMLSQSTLNITATEGWDQAMVTSGGVSLKEIHPATLASKLIPGLYFAGEIIDLDGPCGGFNLQWATSSGWLAGKSAAKSF